MRNESTSREFGCIVGLTKLGDAANIAGASKQHPDRSRKVLPANQGNKAPASRGDNFTPFYSYRVKPPSHDDEVLEKLKNRFGGSSTTVLGRRARPPVPDVAPKPEYDKNGRPVSTMVAHIPPVEPSCRVLRRKDREAERRAYRAAHPDCPHPSGRLWSAGKGRKLCKLCGVKFRVAT